MTTSTSSTRKTNAERRVIWPLALALALGVVGAFAWVLSAQQDSIYELRNRGYGQLENERFEEAEETYRRLVAQEDDDPLGRANLAVALLRQQRNDEALTEIDNALAKAPGRADLLAIRADILHWSGDSESALDFYRRAAAGATDDPELQYALLNHSSILSSEEAEASRREALGRLRTLRPDSLVVMLQWGRLALEEERRDEASSTYLRVRELLWQTQPQSARALQMVVDGLESGDFRRALAGAARLENVIKGAPIYQAALTELYNNIQGIPVDQFDNEPPAEDFGESTTVSWQLERVSDSAGVGAASALLDLNGDGQPEYARIVGTGDSTQLEVLNGTDLSALQSLDSPPLERLLVADLDNDGHLDLLGFAAPSRLLTWAGDGQRLSPTDRFGLNDVVASAGDVIDFDNDGDLDLAIAPDGGALDLYRQALQGGELDKLLRSEMDGPLGEVTELSIPPLRPRRVAEVLAADLDADCDTDLLLVHENGITWLDNLRQGRFANRTAIGGLRDASAATGAAFGDLDNDGHPDLILAASTPQVWRGLGGRFESAPGAAQAGVTRGATAVVAFDANNDGRLDLASVGSGGLKIALQQEEALSFADSKLSDTRGIELSTLTPVDLDGDGDLDLLASGPGGLYRLINDGGNTNHWLRLNLRGLDKGAQRNNWFGRGTTVEIKVGNARQVRELREPTLHLGLGRHRRAEVVRIVWANCVPQNLLDVAGDQTLVEEQVLKGSCPFLYTWNGQHIDFVTDLLWGAPLGMPLAPGVWNGADSSELVEVVGAQPRDRSYDVRITEELWEAAYFDHVKLWVVDEAPGTETASNLRVIPGGQVEDEILTSRNLRAVTQAWDGQGDDVTERVRTRDDVYADGYERSDYQGVSREPWALTFDLGEAIAGSVRLHLDGWIFPADASLNLAIAQRTSHPKADLAFELTRLEAETPEGWVRVMDPMGFPAGKTKTLVLDTPELPAETRRLRIVTSRWLHWDRVAWTQDTDEPTRVVAQLTPSSAELAYRGFSRLVRKAPNAPHDFDYSETTLESPWLPFAGLYTRFGDVLEPLEEIDDRLVVIGPGDEMKLRFDATDLPPLRDGFKRRVFLESHGWDKDADVNTWRADSNLPLPFHGMSGYPFAEGETYPDDEELRRFNEEWQTRRIEPLETSRAALDIVSP